MLRFTAKKCNIFSHQGFLQFQTRQYRLWKKSNNPKFRGKQNTSDVQNATIVKVSSMLDDQFVVNDRKKPIHERSKLSKPLAKPPILELSPQSVGLLEKSGVEVLDIIMDALAELDFTEVLPSVSDPTEFIEIKKVKLNPDCSHADTYWTSEILMDYYRNLLLKRDINSPSLNFTDQLCYNLEDTQKLKSKVFRLTKLLQKYEGFFRSKIVRKINFRRVPRVVFHPDPKMKRLLQKLEMQLEGMDFSIEEEEQEN
jgi:ribosome-binding factor A